MVLSFGRLHSDSEFTAAYALRVTPGRVRLSVLFLSASLAVFVGALSIMVRPWAYQKMHALSLEAERTLNVDAMAAGTFYIGRDGQRVIFLAQRDGLHAPARNVFVELRHGPRIEIIHARLATKLRPIGASDARIRLQDAHIYRINLQNPADDQVVETHDLIINPERVTDAAPDSSALDTSTAQLAASDSPADVAEFQWRLSTAVSTLLLGMLGIPMSRAAPEQSRYTKLGAAIVAYIGYYMLCTSARTWVQHGDIASFPGIWWVPALLGTFVLATLLGPYRTSEFSRGRA